LEKLIVVDCDGVLLDWIKGFNEWMEYRGYQCVPDSDHHYAIETRFGVAKQLARQLVRDFNESAALGFLNAFRDSVAGVQILAENYGYQFDVVTSLGSYDYSQRLRERNIRDVFEADGVIKFRNIHCIPISADKYDILSELYYGKGYYWVEDKEENALAGERAGLKPILLEAKYHEPNPKYAHIPVAKNWADIVNIITK
jgi:hypothetical protein